MLQKLGEIIGLTTNLTVTYDMGMQFDVFTSKGVCSNMGNIGNWPCYKMPITSELISLKKTLEEGKQVSVEELLAVKVCKDLLTYTDMYNQESWIVSNDVLCENLKTAILNLNAEKDAFYAYVDLESWGDNEIKFFTELEGLNDYCTKVFSTDEYAYEEMDDNDLQEAYNTAKENNWFGVPFFDFTSKARKEDSLS